VVALALEVSHPVGAEVPKVPDPRQVETALRELTIEHSNPHALGSGYLVALRLQERSAFFVSMISRYAAHYFEWTERRVMGPDRVPEFGEGHAREFLWACALVGNMSEPEWKLAVADILLETGSIESPRSALEYLDKSPGFISNNANNTASGLLGHHPSGGWGPLPPLACLGTSGGTRNSVMFAFEHWRLVNQMALNKVNQFEVAIRGLDATDAQQIYRMACAQSIAYHEHPGRP
jgi:hypothetical protein